MSAVAIVVGIDAYSNQPLTSAVGDALAFRDALLKLRLLDNGSVTLLTAPAQRGGRLATRDEITAALREQYVHGDDIDRLYVFLSGHGMLVPTTASRSRSATAFLPADVSDPIAEPWKLVNIDDLLQSFRTAGPREQFFFIDACRNLRYDQYPPDLPPIGLGGRGQPAVGTRTQGALYAVSPGGQALGARGGLGVMTAHLLQALDGAGEALDYDDELSSYVVTLQSVHAYVKAKIDEQVSALGSWQRQYMLPEILLQGQQVVPIRLVPDPGPASLTLTVDPPSDAQYVNVSLLQRGIRLAEPQWPPEQFEQPVDVPRQRFRLSAGSYFGAIRVEPELVDARTMTTARITHKYFGPLGPGPVLPPEPVPPSAEPGLGPAAVTYSEPASITVRGTVFTFAEPSPVGTLVPITDEPWATIDVAGVDPPYVTQSAVPPHLVPPELALPGGSYRVTFRVGGEVFSEAVAEVESQRTTSVRATAAASPLVASLAGGQEHPVAVEFAEVGGKSQANPALSLVTLLALSKVRGSGRLLHNFAGVDLEPGPPVGGWLSVCVAVDGSAWRSSARDVASGIRAFARTPDLMSGQVPLSPAEGLGPVVTGIAVPIRVGSTLVLTAEQLGVMELALAADPRLVTSVGIVFRADGGLDVAQVLTAPYLDPATAVRSARRSLLGQWLYLSGELTGYRLDLAPGDLRDILTGDEADPVLSAMAFHSWSRAPAPDRPESSLAGSGGTLFGARVARKLTGEFPEIADSAVIAATLDPRSRDRLIRIAQAGHMPVLADSTRAAAAILGDSPSPLTDMARRIPPASVWTLRWNQPDAQASEET